jgi:membrane protein YdbS with pleckstrin-like domain
VLKEFTPHPALLTIWRIVAAGVMVVPAFVIQVLFRFGSMAWIVGAGVWLVVFLLLYLAYLPLLFRRLSYAVEETRIVRRSGLLFRSVRSFPLAGIQYSTLVQNPIDRVFNLASIILVVAGGRMILPGLREDDAKKLADRLGERA